MSALDLPEELSLERLQRAHELSADAVVRTPILTAGSLSRRLGGSLGLKAENLQRTGSFKLRGALNKVRGSRDLAGVVAGSAGNHAQALAYAARIFGVPCEVYMPVDASVGKMAAVRAFGAEVHAVGESVEESVEMARTRAEEAGFLFVHPFDDIDVIAGQAGVGLELLEDRPELGTVIVPIGGGGLISGVAAAIRQVRPGVRIVGVEAERCAPFAASLAAGAPVSVESVATIADGIAVKRPGELTLPLIEQLVDEIVTVSESAIAAAMALLLERSKLVVEGAGAASLAAVTSGQVELDHESDNLVVLSGGNVDIGLLAKIAARQESLEGRRLRLFTKVSDHPGGLARLLTTIAATKANLLTVEHVRESSRLDVHETAVELTLETRGPEHAERVREALRDAGYELGDL
ncbi:MAG TPA: threonine ammonia-lyase [Solirubrobacterales bacterium]|nr:threonine ammonia-lyase [Solirubrobacterales bacterium]